MRAVSIALVLIAVLAAPAAAAPKQAPGAPGGPATWLPADKHGFGTSKTRTSPVWFTLSDASMTEAYYPDLSTPSVRSLQLAVSDGRSFTTLDDSRPGRVKRLDGLTFRQTISGSGWRLTRTYVTDRARATVLTRVKLRSLTGRRLRLYALLDPGLSNDGSDDHGRSTRHELVAWDGKSAVTLRSGRPFRETSSGYVGTASDPWKDLSADNALDNHYVAAIKGNVVQMARLALDGVHRRSATLALGFGAGRAAARTASTRSLRTGFAAAARSYAKGWRRYRASLKATPSAARPVRDAYDASAFVLAASEDKQHPGAYIASPSMPWDWSQLTLEKPSGVYHEVWSRDLYEIATALIADGDTAGASRALDFLLFHQQLPDGHFPQNSFVDGTQHWTEVQLDQTAFPIVLAWQLKRFDARRWAQLRKAAEYIVANGPQTNQERWENQGGWSPATIAAEIAGLVCAADIARRNGDTAAAARYEATADAWQKGVESWTATSNGPYSPKPYYLRITKDAMPNLGTTYKIGDGGPVAADQRTVVDPSFLELVRLGVKRADDATILNTIQVVDAQLAADTPNGRFWHRFTYDGYGERDDGTPWAPTPDGSGLTHGRVWPIFAGERGEYELAAGQTADARLRAMAATANDGGMIAEQVWDGRPPTGTNGFVAGEGTLSATPLAWSHAQLLRLAWSIVAKRPIEQPRIVACRYTGSCG
jgi:glucoamylase